MKTATWRLVLVTALAVAGSFVFSNPVPAQGITGTILGTVTDKTGGVLPGVSVVVTNTGTGLTRTHVSDDRGRYEERQLPIGQYEVKAELPGFKTQARQLTLTIGSEVVINFALELGTVEETVTVTGESPIVQTSSAEVGALVDQKMIQQLPLNARDIQQLATIQPGVQSQAAYNGLYGANLTVRGSRPEQNRYLLNGIDASTTFGTSPVSAANIIMGVEGLQEFRVLTSDYSAAYGVKQGGVINMVTKAGTNTFHGSAYEFHRDESTEARNFFNPNPQPPPFERDQFGGSIGGPIMKGKTFFFTNYEQFRQRLGLTRIAFVPTDRARQGYLPDPRNPGQEIFYGVAPQMQAFINLIPRGNGPVLSDGYTQQYYSSPEQSIDERYATVRIDHRLGNNDQLWGVYTGDWSTSTTPEANSNFAAFLYRDKTIWSVENVHTFSERLINATRVGFNRNWYFDETTAVIDIPSNMYVAADPFVTPSGRGQLESIGSMGSMTGMANSGNAPVWYHHTGISIDTEFNYVRGAHSWKFGGSWSRSADDGSYSAVQARGEISFDTYQDFLRGVATRANVILPGSDPTKNFRSQIGAVFGEDSWRMANNFTMSLGLRWEALLQMDEARGKIANLRGGPMDPTPTVGNPILIAQKNNVAPRVGFNWDVFGDGRTSLRGGGGMFYNQINPFSLRESSNNVPITTQVSITNAPFPNVFDGIVPGNVRPDFGGIEFRPKTPVLYSYHVALQREIWGKIAVSLSYVGSQGRHLPSGTIVNSDWGNRLIPQIVDGKYFWPTGLTRPNPNFNRIGYGQFVLSSQYNALQVAVERRLAQGFAFTGNYTFARCFDDASGELNNALGNGGGPAVMQYARDLKSGRGPCSFTSVHSGNITTTWDLPGKSLKGVTGGILGGWRWSTITTMQGGYPFNVTTGFNRSRQNVTSSALGDRPNWAPGCSADNVILSQVNAWFDVNCFVMNDAGYLGNVPARALRGPGLFTSDWSLTKTFQLGGGKRIEVEAQAFNVTNRANFRVPASSLWQNATTRNPNAGRITATVTPARQAQFGVKFVF